VVIRARNVASQLRNRTGLRAVQAGRRFSGSVAPVTIASKLLRSTKKRTRIR